MAERLLPPSLWGSSSLFLASPEKVSLSRQPHPPLCRRSNGWMTGCITWATPESIWPFQKSGERVSRLSESSQARMPHTGAYCAPAVMDLSSSQQLSTNVGPLITTTGDGTAAFSIRGDSTNRVRGPIPLARLFYLRHCWLRGTMLERLFILRG
jgi:hypothetical protein